MLLKIVKPVEKQLYYFNSMDGGIPPRVFEIQKVKFQIIAPFVLALVADICKAMRLATSMLYCGYMGHALHYIQKWPGKMTFLFLPYVGSSCHTAHRRQTFEWVKVDVAKH